MRFVVPRSEIRTDEVGWIWLQPRTGSTRVRHTVGTFVLALLILTGAATWILLPSPASVVATLLVAAIGGWLLVGIVTGAGSRVALSDLGLFIQDGGRAAQVGWAAVVAVTARPAGRRWRIRIDDGHRPRTTRAAFDAAAARQWLSLVSAEASRRQLAPLAVAGGGGFTTGNQDASTARTPAPRPPS